MEDIKETRHSKCRRASAHVKAQRLWQYKQGLGRSGSDGVPVIRVEVAIDLHP